MRLQAPATPMPRSPSAPLRARNSIDICKSLDQAQPFPGLSRRTFVSGLTAACLSSSMHAAGSNPFRPPAAQAGHVPIVDAHIHLFNPGRPGGVPWPTPADGVLFQPALPARYRKATESLNVVAAIAIECSPLLSDNDWLLQTAHADPVVVGIIGDLDPASRSFPAELERLHRDSLFLGIRYGNLWNRDPALHLADPLFLENLRLFAHTGLLLETANPSPALIATWLQLIDRVPDLRLVIDHLPHALPPEQPGARKQYLDHLRELSLHPAVFVKGSEIVRAADGKPVLDLAVYRPWLDTIWNLFGDDRVFFGSDWPNSDTTSPIADVFTIAGQYLATRSTSAAQNYFWRNSVRIYNWKPRTEFQHALLTRATSPAGR